MRPSGHNDPVLELLSRLPDATPDPVRSARVHQRMHSGLRRGQRAVTRRQVLRRRIETVTVAGFSLAYAAVLVRQLLHWYGVL
jgi:hypothetical protein